jgi:hypothetical protein
VFTTLLALTILLVAGMALWTLAEYLLHRFAMHALEGKGMMSREHLEHHVHSYWYFSYTHLLSWTGVFVVAGLVWAPIGWMAFGPVGAALGAGWVVGGIGWRRPWHATSRRTSASLATSRSRRRARYRAHRGKPSG